MKTSKGLIILLAIALLSIGIGYIGGTFMKSQSRVCLQKYVVDVQAVKKEERDRIMRELQKVTPTKEAGVSGTLTPTMRFIPSGTATPTR